MMNEQTACENQQAVVEQALREVEARVASLEVLSGRLQDRLLLAERKVGSLASPHSEEVSCLLEARLHRVSERLGAAVRTLEELCAAAEGALGTLKLAK